MHLRSILFLAALVAAPAFASQKGACVDCATLTGSVSESVSGAPLAGVGVVVSAAGNPSQVYTATTNGLGSYTTGAVLPPGDYVVRSDSPDHINVMHPAVRCESGCNLALATTVSLAANATRVVNLQLVRGGSIGGQLTSQVPGVEVPILLVHRERGWLYTARAQWPPGTWNTGHVLPAGSYRVVTNNESGLIDEVWPGVDCPGTHCPDELALPVAVTEGNAVTGIDFALRNGARVSGTVRRAADSVPVEGAIVFVSNPAETMYLAAATAADGTYQTRGGLPPGEWRAYTHSAPGLLGERWPELPCANCNAQGAGPIQIANATPATGIDFTLDVYSHLRGTITAVPGDTPLEGALVDLFDAGGAAIVTVPTAADGRYDSGPIAPGSYRVQARADGHATNVYGAGACAPSCTPLDGQPVIVIPGQDVDGIDIALGRAASIGGRLTGAGGVPLANVRVDVLTPQMAVVADAFTDANGDYRVSGLQPGTYLVRSQPDGDHVRTLWPDIPCTVFLCFDKPRPQITLAAFEQRNGVDIAAVLGGRFAGTVTSNGAPIPNVRITLTTPGNRFAGSLSTDNAGEYRSEALEPGSYLLRTYNEASLIDEIHANVPCSYGCSRVGTPVALAAGNTLDIDFDLAAGGTLAGSILDTNGNPLANPNTAVVILDPQGRTVQYAYAGPDGFWRSSGLAPGTYYLRTENDSGRIDELYQDAACFWCTPPNGNPVTVVTGGFTGGIDFRLDAGSRLSGRVTQGNGVPMPFAGLMLFDAQGLPIAVFGAAQDGTWVYPGGLAPGTYYLRTANFGSARDELLGGRACHGNCDVRAGTPVVVLPGSDRTNLDFDLEDVLFLDGFETVVPFF